MTDQIELLSGQILATDSAAAQEALAEDIAKICRNQPAELGLSTEFIFDVLRDTDGQVRATLSEALFNLGQENRDAVTHLARPVLSYLTRESLPNQVKIELGRVLGDATAGASWALTPDAIPSLVTLLDDDEKWFRHSIAWALEIIAHAHPSELSHYADELHSYLDDPHPPVAKHICRALAHLQRYQPHHNQEMVHTVADNLHAHEESLRTAASILLGAIGTSTAIESLRGRHQLEDHAEIRLHIRQALREATFPDEFHSDTEVDIATVSTGDWLALDTQDSSPRTSRYRGVVWEIDTTVGSQSQTQVRLANPYEGYTVSVTINGRGRNGTYSDQRTSDAKPITVTDAYQLNPRQVALLYALEGDTIEFNLDGPTYAITVSGVDGDSQTRRVWGSDDSKNTVEFRPCSHDPLLACFDEGRCFEMTAVALDPAEELPEDTL